MPQSGVQGNGRGVEPSNTVWRGEHLYVIEFSSGVVKVGRTRNPSVRFTSLAQPLRPHGITITGKWLSPRHLSAHRNEELLIEHCAARYGSLNGGDYFAGASPEDVIAFATTLGREPGSCLSFAAC